eukprot:PhM_4_TR1285/c2_g4_i1/m.7147
MNRALVARVVGATRTQLLVLILPLAKLRLQVLHDFGDVDCPFDVVPETVTYGDAFSLRQARTDVLEPRDRTTHLVDSVRGVVDSSLEHCLPAALRLQKYVVPQLDGFESQVKLLAKLLRPQCLLNAVHHGMREATQVQLPMYRHIELRRVVDHLLAKDLVQRKVGKSCRGRNIIVVADVILTRQKVKRLQIANMAIRHDGNDVVHGHTHVLQHCLHTYDDPSRVQVLAALSRGRVNSRTTPVVKHEDADEHNDTGNSARSCVDTQESFLIRRRSQLRVHVGGRHLHHTPPPLVERRPQCGDIRDRAG